MSIFIYLFGDIMKIPLVFDEQNPKYMLLNSIFIIIDSREVKQELARNGIKPTNSFIKTLKIRFISMFFDIDNKYVVNEINNSFELREKFGIKSILDYQKFSKNLSEVESDKILEFVLKTINKQFIKSKRGKRIVIVDATLIMLDINLDKKYYTDEKLEEKGFKMGYSKTHGSYVGYKLTLAIDFHT